MQKAIITFGVGYGEPELKSFLESCKKYAPDADVFLYAGKNARSLRKLHDRYPRLRVIRFRENLLARAIHKVFSYSPAMHFRYARALQRLGKVSILRPLVYRLASPMLQFMVRRFFRIEGLLSRIPHERIMLTDLRDVVLQGDPFAMVGNRTIVSGIEPRTIEECPMNGSWVKRTYGDATYELLKGKNIVCAGVTIGSRLSVGQYVKEMNEEIVSTLSRNIATLGPDQAIHIVLFYQRLMGLERNLETNGSGSIATLHYSTLREFKLNQGRLENYAGRRLAVVHQYDRHPTLARELLNGLGLQTV